MRKPAAGCWIKEYRERVGMSAGEFAAALREMGRKRGMNGLVSRKLLEYLEYSPSAVTHPRLASLIADACGATAKQRDAITPEQYRGGYRQREAKVTGKEVKPWKRTMVPQRAEQKERSGPNRAPVVALDKSGNELGRYVSVKRAAMESGFDEQTVRRRCQREMMGTLNGMIFRYADDWDAMTEEQRRADMGSVVWREQTMG